MKTILPSNTNYGGNRASTKYIVIHYCGSVGTAEANANYFKTANRGASAHYFVGHDGEIISSVPENKVAWHCGASKYKHPECRNSNSIGVEMCCKKLSTKTVLASDKDWYFTPETVESAILFVVELMKKYNIDVNHVVRHYDVTGKTCPAPYVHDENQWSLFKLSLEMMLGTNVNPVAFKETTDVKVEPKPVSKEFKVKTKCVMNIRQGTSTTYPIVGEAPKGVYTIVEQSGNWGKLKSGAGWINISAKYAERV